MTVKPDDGGGRSFVSDVVTVGDQGLDDVAGSVDTGAAPPPPAGGVRQRIMQVLKLTVSVAVLAAVGYALVINWDKATGAWAKLTWPTVVLSGVAVLAGLVASSIGWRDAARDIGCPVALPAALRIFMIGQLAKYIPGTVWVYLLQTELGRRAGVPRARAFLASITAMAMGITAALVVGAAGLYSVITSPDTRPIHESGIRVGIIVAIALLPVALVCIIPRVLTPLVSRALRLMRRPPLETPLTWSGVLRVLGWSIVTWLCYGVHLCLLVSANAHLGFSGVMWCIGASALAVTVGMFFPTPSGVGGREYVLYVIIAPLFPGGQALGIAMGTAFASRMIFTVAEVIGAGLAALTDLSGMRRLASSKRS
jgi:glycosyltransferase 2 family protein